MHLDFNAAPITNTVVSDVAQRSTGFRGLHAGIKSIDIPFLEPFSLTSSTRKVNPWPKVLYPIGIGRHTQAPAADRGNSLIQGGLDSIMWSTLWPGFVN
jgi:hypothetical protein